VTRLRIEESQRPTASGLTANGEETRMRDARKYEVFQLADQLVKDAT
jgi:hypothetical protein